MTLQTGNRVWILALVPPVLSLGLWLEGRRPRSQTPCL